MNQGEALRHRRIAELFVRATEMETEDRNVFLERLEREDADLRREVESLLEHHTSRSIITPSPEEEGAGERALGPLKRLSSSGGLSTGSVLSRLVGSPARRTGAVAFSLIALAALGLWTYTSIEHALLEMRADELQSALDATTVTFETWLKEQKYTVESMAADPRVRRLTDELLEQVRSGEVAIEALDETPAYAELRALLRPGSRRAYFGGADIFDPRGQSILLKPLGAILTPYGFSILGKVLGGETVYFRPHRLHEALVTEEVGGGMYTGVAAPIRNAEGEIIALLGWSHEASNQFSAVVGFARVGDTGETYAFRPDGLMASRSRFDEDLRARGFVLQAEDTTTVLNLEIRDPGGDVLDGFEPSLPLTERPLTRLADRALASRSSSDSLDRQGVILKPYRNYRGAEVIGAWRWFSTYDFGIAAEIETAEAFAPLRYLQIAFGVIFILLVVSVVVALVNSFAVVRLRRRFGSQRQLGQYALLEEIGEGGMGKVYLAQHAMLKRPTAVKVMTGERVTNESLARFEREVQLASRLSHPNTIEIYDYGVTPDGVFYYAMEFLPGLSLAELVSTQGPVPEARAMHVLKQACASLEEAHWLGMIHRDIKPGNIMLCQRGGMYDVVKVLDFGLAKKIVDPNTLELTGPARIGGTPIYMAPERIESPSAVDHRVDIYSLGAVAYYLVTGRPIFTYKDELDLLFTIVSKEPRRPSEVSDNSISLELEKLILDCLAKDPDRRPMTVTEVRVRLEAIRLDAEWSTEAAASWWQTWQSARMAEHQVPPVDKTPIAHTAIA